MKILHVYKSAIPYSMGGVEQVVHQLAMQSSRMGHDVTVLCVNRSGYAEPKPAEPVEYRLVVERSLFEFASTPFSWSVISRFAQLHAEADVVHMHYPWPFMDLMYLLARPACPVVVTYHSDIVRQRFLRLVYKPLQRIFLSSVQKIIATSPNYLATSRELNKHRDKVEVIPIGVDEASYPAVDASVVGQWEKRIGTRSFFLFVGVLRYYKGLHVLLEAARHRDYPVVIVGAGPTEAALKKQAQRYQLTNVHFLGHLSDVDKVALLSLCRAVVFPSHLRSEAFGLTLLEGAMMGKPLISSEIGTGTSFVNIDGETGIVIAPDSVMALLAAMDKICNDPERAECLGCAARVRFQEFFGANRMAKAYIKVYELLSMSVTPATPLEDKLFEFSKKPAPFRGR
jgi:glycosyltransferase involved in cell wall biosynthesis